MQDSNITSLQSNQLVKLCLRALMFSVYALAAVNLLHFRIAIWVLLQI